MLHVTPATFPNHTRTGLCAIRAKLTRSHRRFAASHAVRRQPREEGSIASIFTSLTDEKHTHLPERFADLKKSLWKDSLVESWREVLRDLEGAVEVITSKRTDLIPRMSYSSVKNGMTEDQVDQIKATGVVVITGAVQKETALSWKESIKQYVNDNVDKVKGTCFPPDNIQVFELYNSKAQVAARTNPEIVNTQPEGGIDLNAPISYFDRLRIRQPGDAKFALGPHIDWGSAERWEDPGFRAAFGKILEGGSSWRAHNPFDATPRTLANHELDHASNACSIFRPWQGWTSLSSTGPNEGTLRVLPMLSLATAYIILRPFFRPRNPLSSSLRFEDWEVDIDSSTFPGSSIGKTQELNEKTHPHLRLNETMMSISRVEPGDQVYWHCDVVHAVEAQHQGVGDSSVLYIPAVPFTQKNGVYLHDQRENFVSGLPAPDFPGGEGESRFSGRATLEDVKTQEGRMMFGFEPSN